MWVKPNARGLGARWRAEEQSILRDHGYSPCGPKARAGKGMGLDASMVSRTVPLKASRVGARRSKNAGCETKGSMFGLCILFVVKAK
jgi:hypothetical protein